MSKKSRFFFEKEASRKVQIYSPFIVKVAEKIWRGTHSTFNALIPIYSIHLIYSIIRRLFLSK